MIMEAVYFIVAELDFSDATLVGFWSSEFLSELKIFFFVHMHHHIQ